jgi:UDP-N-acetylglucosamine acyltransferase
VSVSVHPTAVVGDKVEFGEDVVVGPYCVIENDVVIGDRTKLDAYANVKQFTTLGADNRLHSYACVGGEPQDLKYQGEKSKLVIGDRNVIREFVTIHRGTEGGGGVTSIGDECLLMAYVHLAHDCRIGNRVIISTGVMLAGHIEVGDYAAFGGMSGVHQFVRIGEYAFVGAKCGVAQDVPPFTLASGERAKLHGLNSIGLRRGGFSMETFSALKSAYKLFFRSGMERSKALDEIEKDYSEIPEVMSFTAFIRASERGVTSASIKSDGDNGDE